MKNGTVISTLSFIEQQALDPESAIYTLFITEPIGLRRVCVGDGWRQRSWWSPRVLEFVRRGRIVASVPLDSSWEIVASNLVEATDVTREMLEKTEDRDVPNDNGEPVQPKYSTGQYV